MGGGVLYKGICGVGGKVFSGRRDLQRILPCKWGTLFKSESGAKGVEMEMELLVFHSLEH